MNPNPVVSKYATFVLIGDKKYGATCTLEAGNSFSQGAT